MNVSIQLPSVFPDLRWIANSLVTDPMILRDDLPFNRKSRAHRGRIRTPNGHHWVHIPIHPDDKHLPLAESRIDHSENWFDSLWKALEFNYRNSIYFDYYEEDVKADLNHVRQMNLFMEAARYLTHRWFRYLELTPPKILYMSEGGEATPDSVSRLLKEADNVTMEHHSKNYLPPVPGASLLSVSIPEYRQHFGGFVADCCVLDLLFETGSDSWMVTDTLRNATFVLPSI